MTPFHAANFQLFRFIAAVTVQPNPSGLPGHSALQKLLDGVAAVMLLACAGAIVIGAAQWGVGSRSHNYSHAADGKSKILYGALGAFVIGAVAGIVNFFQHSGTAIH